ncbi:MAG TPA: hypothetical protein VMY76_17535 [Gemmatimonadales bacterium]|nr:hypothetical protein [Gemmatimonadales bacterium]
MSRAWWLSVPIALAFAVPVRAQTFEAVPDTGRVTVGDPIGIRLILRQYEGDALLEHTPHPEGTLGGGVRLLSVDSMRLVKDRLLEARASIAFYRPGPQTIPAFAIDFRRGAVILHGTMRTAPVDIEIARVLEAGSGARLRDIKEIAEAPGLDPRAVVLAAAATGIAAWALRRRQRRRARPSVPEVVRAVAPEPSDPFTLTLGRLEAIERANWAAAGEVARHYEAVANALRDYLEAAEEIPARERTTRELLWALPPHLNEGGLRHRCELLLDESDLVKFARRRPDAGSAASFLAHARELLLRWRAAEPEREAAHALR